MPAVVRLVSLLVLVIGAIGRSLCLLEVCRVVDLLHVDVDLAVVRKRVAVLFDLRRRVVGLGHRRSYARKDDLRWRLLLL